MGLPKVVTQRPSVPTLWVDTSIALNIATGRDTRCTALKDIARKLVRNGKLLCPSADQHEEFEGRRLDEAAFRVLEDLSLGIHLRHRGGITDSLIAVAMKTYVQGRDTIASTLNTYFHRDPVEQMRAVRRQRLIVSVPPHRNPEIRQRREYAKRAGQAELEAARQHLVAQGQTYEKQFAVELRGYTEFVVAAPREFQRKAEEGTAGFWDFMGTVGPLVYRVMWRRLGAKPSGIEGVTRFFNSDHFAALPTSRIPSQLWADLLTNRDHAIAPGDGMDVGLLSVAIPISNYVVTDKAMESRIKRMAIDREWNMQVFSLRSIDDLLERLRAL